MKFSLPTVLSTALISFLLGMLVTVIVYSNTAHEAVNKNSNVTVKEWFGIKGK